MNEVVEEDRFSRSRGTSEVCRCTNISCSVMIECVQEVASDVLVEAGDVERFTLVAVVAGLHDLPSVLSAETKNLAWRIGFLDTDVDEFCIEAVLEKAYSELYNTVVSIRKRSGRHQQK